jgi:hypothetical protein
MKTDERIRQTKNRVASQGFGIWYLLLLAALLYRQFYLKQPIQQYWDLAAIFFVGAGYVSISIFAKGALPESYIPRAFKWTPPVIIITIVAVNYLLGNIRTIPQLIVTIIFAAVGVSLVMIIFYYLYERWERNI